MPAIRPDVHARFQQLLERVTRRLEMGEPFPGHVWTELNEDLPAPVMEPPPASHAARWRWKGGVRPVRRGPKTCSLCGRPGHTARTCPA